MLKDELRDDDDSKSDLIDEREREKERKRNIVFVILGMRHKASSTECND